MKNSAAIELIKKKERKTQRFTSINCPGIRRPTKIGVQRPAEKQCIQNRVTHRTRLFNVSQFTPKESIIV